MPPPDDALAYAASLLADGRPQEALDEARRAALQQPTTPAPLLLVADALHALGRPLEALDVLEQATALAPDLVCTQIKRGQQLRAMGQLEAAVAWLEPFTRTDEPDADLAFELGQTYVMLDRPADAARAFGIAAIRRPDWPEALGNRGTALGLAGQITESCETFERALALQPDNATWWFNLGLARWARRQRPAALNALIRAEELKPALNEAITEALGRPLARIERQQRLIRLLIAGLPLLLLLAWLVLRF